MHKLFKVIALLVLCVVLALPAMAQSTIPGAAFARVTTETINIRTAPNISSQIIATANRGAMYPILERTNYGNWLLVDVGGFNGWIFAGLTTIINEEALPPIQYPLLAVPTTTGAATLGQGGGFVDPNAVTSIPIPVQTAAVQPAVAAFGQGGGFVPSDQIILGTGSLVNENPIALGNVNMRVGPGTNFRYFWRVPNGEAVTLLGRNAGGTWLFVDHLGNQGWVSTRYMLLPLGLDVASIPVVG